MRFVVFLLAVAAVLAAVAMLLIGIMASFTDNPRDPGVLWGYVLVLAAVAAIVFGGVAAVTVWAKPGAAAKLLWVAAAGGLAGMAAQGAMMFLVRNNPNAPDAYNVFTAILASGTVPAIAAAVAALLTQRCVLPR